MESQCPPPSLTHSLSHTNTNIREQVRLYMESQCPMCKKFSTTYIKQMLATKEMRDIVDFRFVPWGNGGESEGVREQVFVCV